VESNNQETKNKLLRVAKELLSEGNDISKITVRQIATRADVGVGLMNYHFKSKDHLLNIAIKEMMADVALNFTDLSEYNHLDPIDKLKEMLKKLCSLVGHDEKLIHLLLSHELYNNNMQAPLFLIPLLKEIFGGKKDDFQLRIIALQIYHPIQVSSLNPSAFHLYSGINLHNVEQRSQFINQLGLVCKIKKSVLFNQNGNGSQINKC
jgi:AcrR family transcriptional regulator